jgi:hypothetical protein
MIKRGAASYPAAALGKVKSYFENAAFRSGARVLSIFN